MIGCFRAARVAKNSDDTGVRKSGTAVEKAGLVLGLAEANHGHDAGTGVRFVDTAANDFCAGRPTMDDDAAGGRESGTVV